MLLVSRKLTCPCLTLEHQNMAKSKEEALQNKLWWLLFITVVCLSFTTRFYKIEEPSHVCWDEVHFGKMGSSYIKGKFFFDVHPPLGKMLIGLTGTLTGYDGSFTFKKAGDKYGNVSYVGMRMMCAAMGSIVPILCFCTVWKLVNSLTAAALVATMVTLDTGTLILSQYILLDPFMMCFIMAATWSHVNFMAQKQRPFSLLWWFWLATTGLFLALAIGVKFVGLFIIVLIGVSTVADLWDLLGNLTLSMGLLLYHLMARAWCLILLPVVVYLIIFTAHFKVLINSGDGDGFFSSAFQSQLIGNKLYNVSMPQEVSFGSVVTIKSRQPGGAYLHSHHDLYPEGVGARQQQVTGYSHKDDNNLWQFKTWKTEPKEGDDPVLVKHDDLVRLEHVKTTRNLHSHEKPAPITIRHKQVTCYGINGTGDDNDVFRLVIVDSNNKKNTNRTTLKAVGSMFQLIHVDTGCTLQSHDQKLPEWGSEQFEVTCNPNANDRGSYWNIEEIHDSRLKNESFEVFAPSFYDKFFESHVIMFQGNSGLKPKPGEVVSRPWQWPLNYKGQLFSGGDHRVYLLGNPVIWWTCLGGMVLFIIVYGVDKVLRQRNILQGQTSVHLSSCLWLFFGWCLHYIPFWSMTRILYYHHYFPAFLYSAMLTGILMDFLIDKISSYFKSVSHLKEALVVCIIAVFAYSFYVFSPLVYGMHGPTAEDPKSIMTGLKWLHTWEF